MKKIAVIGYGVIGKRVADAIKKQGDMELTGVCDVINDWRIQNAVNRGYDIYAATPEAEEEMNAAGISVKGGLAELLAKVDLAVDCTPKKVASKNVEIYKEKGIKFSLYPFFSSPWGNRTPLSRMKILRPNR